MRILIAAVLSFGLLACAPDEPAHDAQMSDGVVISQAYVRPPLPGRSMAAAYFRIDNHGEADRLLSVSSPISDRVEMHTHLKEGGVMKMRKLEGLDLPAGETVMFQPGSHHIMMFDTSLTENDTDASLTLTFEKAGDVTVIADLNDGSNEPKPNHSGH